MRFVDIRGTEVNIWEPAVLARLPPEEDASDMSSIEVKELSLPERTEIDETTSVTAKTQQWYVFCGTRNGLIKGYESDMGKPPVTLYSYAHGIAITRMIFHDVRELLASADSSSRTVVQRLVRIGAGWKEGFVMLDHRMDEAIEQLLFNPDGTNLLIVTTTTDSLFPSH